MQHFKLLLKTFSRGRGMKSTMAILIMIFGFGIPSAHAENISLNVKVVTSRVTAQTGTVFRQFFVQNADGSKKVILGVDKAHPNYQILKETIEDCVSLGREAAKSQSNLPLQLHVECGGNGCRLVNGPSQSRLLIPTSVNLLACSLDRQDPQI